MKRLHQQAARGMRLRAAATLLVIAIAASMDGCIALPPLDGRTKTTAIGGEPGTRLHDSIAPITARHPGNTGIFALDDGRTAFAVRVALAEAAQRSLDAQYYIWHDDTSGRLLFGALCRAADRGVRVRVLLDDNGTKGMDATLAALAAHANVQLRLFNPFVYRSARVWSYATDFSRLNRRMHNKSFTADGVATIVGGRNIGDEYFGAGDGVGYIDLDVLAIGAAVAEVQKSFDDYWNSASAYPAERILPGASDSAIAVFAAAAHDTLKSAEAQQYLEAVRRTEIVNNLSARQVGWEWGEARLVVDDPAKALDRAERNDYLMSSLEHVVGSPSTDLMLVSPYFVPTAAGVEGFEKMRARGVRVSILTNALESTDVAAVHAGYVKQRKALLRQGVKLWEVKSTAAPIGVAGGGGFGSSGKSGNASLHAKTFAMDHQQVFVGSFNFDPRSAALNTEMGLVIHSSVLADRLAQTFEDRVPRAAYEVKLTSEGKLQWIERQPQGEIVHSTEPGTSRWRRFCVGVLALLPIDWLL